jgi:hypothetical protein
MGQSDTLRVWLVVIMQIVALVAMLFAVITPSWRTAETNVNRIESWGLFRHCQEDTLR